jgi:hypothetical protein
MTENTRMTLDKYVADRRAEIEAFEAYWNERYEGCPAQQYSYEEWMDQESQFLQKLILFIDRNRPVGQRR